MQKETSVINNNETLNYNNSPLKIDINQSFMPKQSQTNIKRFYLISSMKKPSAFNNNPLKKNENFYKIQPKQNRKNIRSFSPKFSDIKSSSPLNKGANNCNNIALKTNINKSFSKILPYPEDIRRTNHNSPNIKKSIIDNNLNLHNPLKIYIPKQHLKNNRSFDGNSKKIKRSINQASNFYDNPSINNLTKSYSIAQFENTFYLKTNEQTISPSEKRGRKNYLNIHRKPEKYIKNYKQYLPKKETNTLINIED